MFKLIKKLLTKPSNNNVSKDTKTFDFTLNDVSLDEIKLIKQYNSNVCKKYTTMNNKETITFKSNDNEILFYVDVNSENIDSVSLDGKTLNKEDYEVIGIDKNESIIIVEDYKVHSTLSVFTC